MKYQTVPAGPGNSVATVLPDFDFETYSEAGYYFDFSVRKWKLLPNTPKGTTSGLAAVGAAVYAQHPTTEVLFLAYDLKDGRGAQLWKQGDPPPIDLFHHLQSGGLIEAHNSGFEAFIWQYVCVEKMGWPAFDYDQLRCSKSKCRAWAIPGGLGKAAQILGTPVQKDKDGKRLLNMFSKPHTPTKKNPLLRNTLAADPIDAAKLGSYCVDDIRAEAGVSLRVPDLQPQELEMWKLDQQINRRGVYIDEPTLDACIEIVEQATWKYTQELIEITGGQVKTASELKNMTAFLSAQGVEMASLDADAVAHALTCDTLPPLARRVLEIRAALGSASVKKVYAIKRRLCRDGRIRDLFEFCGADRTGRFAGRGPQPQNMPSSGPDVVKCSNCGKHQGAHNTQSCKWCMATGTLKPVEWGIEAALDAKRILHSRRVDAVEEIFGDAFATVSGCLRGLFRAAPGHVFICSDYSAIEAVVLAELAGEEWRIEVFRTHGKIYEMSAARITGVPFEEFVAHKERTGEHHPLRKKIGKVAELASGYGGWIGAWKAFGADKHIGDDKAIKDAILAWREASPNIVEFWGGQVRKHPDKWEFKHELFGLEGCAVAAIMNPGQCFTYRMITYGMHEDVLYCRLPSGRFLAYHEPRLTPTPCRLSKLPIWRITYRGRSGTGQDWVELDTYGGKLAENVTQATARDVMTHALPNLDKAGYKPVIHVHDEAVCEVPEGFGSVEEFEQIMSTMPDWAADWPIRAAGGWVGQQYRKD